MNDWSGRQATLPEETVFTFGKAKQLLRVVGYGEVGSRLLRPCPNRKRSQ